MEKRNNEQLVGLMSLSEEIGVLNHKVKELVHDLHNTQNVLGTLQELANNLNSKVGEFNTGVGNYEPIVEEDETNPAEASYLSNGRKRQRVTPTPYGVEGEEELELETLEVKKEEDPIPTVEKITEVTKMDKDFSHTEEQPDYETLAETKVEKKKKAVPPNRQNTKKNWPFRDSNKTNNE